MTRTITNEQATYLHNVAVAANYPADALRINYYRIGGGGMETLLSVPGNDNAPCYRRNMRGEWIHVSGSEIDAVAADMDMRDQSEYGVNEWQYRNPAAAAAQIEEWNEAFERAAIERHDDIH